MAATEKVVYLCDGTRSGIVYNDNCSGGASLSLDALGKGTISLVPELLPPKIITVKMLAEGQNPNSIIPPLTWEMVSDSINGDPPHWIIGARIKGTVPQACDWKESRIKSAFNTLPILRQKPSTYEIPDSKSDVLKGGDLSTTVTNLLTPGEGIWIENDYSLTDSNASSMHYWRTIAMSGGTIVEKWPHATIADLYQYDVDVEGVVYNDLLPTDYYNYSVGEWVFVLTLTPAAVIQDRTTLTPSTIGSSSQIRIAPYNINGHGQAQTIKNYLVSDFNRWANMRILYAIINSINGDTESDHSLKINKATITLSQTGQSITDVPITYWCQNNSTTKSAHAFQPGDVVMVAFDGFRDTPNNQNSIIIGHAASVYPCTTTTTTTTEPTTTTTTTTSSTTSTTTTTTIPPVCRWEREDISTKNTYSGIDDYCSNWHADPGSVPTWKNMVYDDISGGVKYVEDWFITGFNGGTIHFDTGTNGIPNDHFYFTPPYLNWVGVNIRIEKYYLRWVCE